MTNANPSIFRNVFVFVLGYVTLMIPTYVLPWLGSNSAVFNAVGVAVGHGLTPQWWAHAWCLVMLILMTWLRGSLINKKYLPVFPFLATVFDLTPGLSMIPLIPTVLHLAAIILGVQVGVQQPIVDGEATSSVFGSTSSKAGTLAGLMTVAAIIGSVLFISTSKKSLSEFAGQKSGMPIKALPAKLTSPLPVITSTPAKMVVATPASSEELDVAPAAAIDSVKSPAINMAKRRKHAQKKALISDQSTTKDVGEVRYININE